MLEKEIKYSLCDMEIVPARISNIEHRSDIVVTDEDGHLPIFAAPMDSVCDDTNYMLFEKQGIIPTIHRNVNPNIKKELLKKGVWVAPIRRVVVAPFIILSRMFTDNLASSTFISLSAS